ncbi:MAG TPA: hypothetical protein VH458_19295 [Vicinamibacterales bacterium]
MRRGESGFVAGGPPMVLTSVGRDTRRALVLVLHDSQQSWMTVAADGQLFRRVKTARGLELRIELVSRSP